MLAEGRFVLLCVYIHQVFISEQITASHLRQKVHGVAVREAV